MSERARNYQVKTDRELARLLALGKRPLVVMPTGAGKTYTARMRLREYRRPAAVTHTKVLRDQTAENIPECEVFMMQGLIMEKGPKAAARRDRFASADVVWVDEAHHPVGPDWSRLLPLIGERPCFGSTATPQRADGTPLSEFWTDLIVGAQYSELLALGHLCPCDVAEPDMKRKDQRKNKMRPDGVLSYLQLGKREDGSWRPAIHTDKSIADCERALGRYREAGIRCALVCCDTEDDDRQVLFDEYSAGHLDLLASPMALSEGFDSPRAEVLVSQRSFSHVGTYIQWCGRILRPYTAREIDKWTAKLAAKGIAMHPSALVAKRRALFIDTTDAASMHRSPTQDRAYSLDGKGITDAPEPEEETEQKPHIERAQIREFEAKYKIIQDKVVEHYLQLEQLAREKRYRPGWVYYKLRDLGIDPPRQREALHPDPCAHCQRQVSARASKTRPGEQILWAGGRTVYHPECFLRALDRKTLERAHESLMRA